MEVINQALKKGQKSLSEHESKQLLTAKGIAVSKEALAQSPDEAKKLAREMGFPVVLKASGALITHKTEKNLVELYVKNEAEVAEAYQGIAARAGKDLEGVLVQEMVIGRRELVMGLTRDAQFGPCVMFGLGGVLTEVLNDVAFRVAPLEKRDALEMMQDIRGAKILQPFRGEPAADLETLSRYLIALGEIGLEYPQVQEIDINPVILSKRGPVAVDALVILNPNGK